MFPIRLDDPEIRFLFTPVCLGLIATSILATIGIQGVTIRLAMKWFTERQVTFTKAAMFALLLGCVSLLFDVTAYNLPYPEFAPLVSLAKWITAFWMCKTFYDCGWLRTMLVNLVGGLMMFFAIVPTYAAIGIVFFVFVIRGNESKFEDLAALVNDRQMEMLADAGEESDQPAFKFGKVRAVDFDGGGMPMQQPSMNNFKGTRDATGTTSNPFFTD